MGMTNNRGRLKQIGLKLRRGIRRIPRRNGSLKFLVDATVRAYFRDPADFHSLLFLLRERRHKVPLPSDYVLANILPSSDTGVTWYLFIYIPGILIRIFHTTHQLLLHSSHREAAAFAVGVRDSERRRGRQEIKLYSLYCGGALCLCAAPLRLNETP